MDYNKYNIKKTSFSNFIIEFKQFVIKYKKIIKQ